MNERLTAARFVGDEPLSEDSLQKRRARFSVVAGSAGAIAATGVAAQFLKFGERRMAAYMALAALLYLFTWLLYRGRRYRLTPIYLAWTALLAMSLANILFLRQEAGDHHFLLIVAALTPLAMHSRDRVWGVTVTALAILVFAAVELLDWRRPFEVTIGSAQVIQYRNAAVVMTIVFMTAMIVYIDRRLRDAQETARLLHLRSESLLRNILPDRIAEQLKNKEGPIAERHGNVSILFADLVGFTDLSRSMKPEALVEILNRLFSEFDSLAEGLSLEKIKTIGDSYMVAGGLPIAREDHAQAVAHMAIGILGVVRGLTRRLGYPLNVRIGIHSGEVVAGVIGHKKFSYDLWGDTVNTAARMESHGLPGEIQVSAATRNLIDDEFVTEPRGSIEIKGLGTMETWLLKRARGVQEAKNPDSC